MNNQNISFRYFWKTYKKIYSTEPRWQRWIRITNILLMSTAVGTHAYFHFMPNPIVSTEELNEAIAGASFVILFPFFLQAYHYYLVATRASNREIDTDRCSTSELKGSNPIRE